MKENAFAHFFEIVKAIRKGCPWDKEQTPLSLRSTFFEETCEAIDAISQEDPAHVKEELGDVLLNVVLIAYLFEEKGLFTVDETINAITEKLIRRHPHVFEKKEMTLDQLNVQWDKIKKSEGKKEKLSHEEKFKKMQKLLDSLAPEYGVQ